MVKVILYIATSLDGYIADENSSVNFLSKIPQDPEIFSAMKKFVNGVEFLIMGYNTYNQVVTELSPNEWPYKNSKSFVYTHKKNIKSDIENVTFTDEPLEDLIKTLKSKAKKDIWLVGGANMVGQFHNLDLIDEYRITIVPFILGSGLKLFPKSAKELLLKLTKVDNLKSSVELVYSKK